MWQKHNTHLANFDVTSLRVTAAATTQHADVQVVCDEATRKQCLGRVRNFSKKLKGLLI
jgi:hypothetical protein